MVAGIMQTGRLLEIFEIKDGKLDKISEFNDEIHNSRKYSPPEHFTFNDTDGVEIDGWVMKPVDYEAGKQFPAVLNIHGGPKAAYCESYFHEMQYLANQNYFVMFSNPRGGDGKGNEFADIRGEYGGIDYENLMQFVDECLKKYPEIDAERMAVMGGSYGGFMTNWIVGHTHRFKAAITMRCICNWISFANISDIGPYFGKDQMGDVDIWTDIDKLWHHSPLKYAPNVKTPTLILHSDQDYRCWTPEAYQWFTALKLHKAATRMVLFHGENHELSRSGKPDNRVKRLEEMMAWLEKYL
jgi:dipeptidyl aminopeptidase/acylaminoacyl peptidase